jgi:hypothetical protein
VQNSEARATELILAVAVGTVVAAVAIGVPSGCRIFRAVMNPDALQHRAAQ